MTGGRRHDAVRSPQLRLAGRGRRVAVRADAANLPDAIGARVVTTAAVRGWCPDAWRPMMAGDGFLLRVRPPLARLTRAQALGLCAASVAFGNGLIDATSRGNLQIRGVTESDWRALVDRLVGLGVTDADPAREARANLLVAPDWQAGDDTHRIATALAARRDDLPALPGKVGFVVDAGAAPVLRDDPGDFRIERGEAGGLIVRMDGRDTGAALDVGTEADALIALACWFVSSGGAAAGRMARHRTCVPGWAGGTIRPAASAAKPVPGSHPLGLAVGMPFGRIDATALARFIDDNAIEAIRVTPWRTLLFEGAVSALPDALVDDADASAMRVDACVGAPACPQASVETRPLARRLAPHVGGRLHVSGCAKGCARAGPATIVLTGRDGLFDLVVDGRAGDPPLRAGLDADQVLAHFGVD